MLPRAHASYLVDELMIVLEGAFLLDPKRVLLSYFGQAEFKIAITLFCE